MVIKFKDFGVTAATLPLIGRVAEMNEWLKNNSVTIISVETLQSTQQNQGAVRLWYTA